jgi:L,D-peptidoglycan transpeptidase YkuD (ErfK/YbiS/YcfS/YnhG family)
MRAVVRALGVLALVAASLAASAPTDASVETATTSATTPVTTQVITVRAGSLTTTYAVLEAWQRTGSGSYRRVAGPWTARLGYRGLAAPGTKREGDGQTPSGRFRITQAFGVAANPGTRLTYFRVGSRDWWDSDRHSTGYNQHRQCTRGSCPFRESVSEHLADYPTQYRYAAFIRYNADPAVPGRGSAIFLHASGAGSTAGCVSVSASRMAWLLRWMRPATATSYAPLISIGVGAAAYAPIPHRQT